MQQLQVLAVDAVRRRRSGAEESPRNRMSEPLPGSTGRTNGHRSRCFSPLAVAVNPARLSVLGVATTKSGCGRRRHRSPQETTLRHHPPMGLVLRPGAWRPVHRSGWSAWSTRRGPLARSRCRCLRCGRRPWPPRRPRCRATRPAHPADQGRVATPSSSCSRVASRSRRLALTIPGRRSPSAIKLRNGAGVCDERPDVVGGSFEDEVSLLGRHAQLLLYVGRPLGAGVDMAGESVGQVGRFLSLTS